MEEPKLFVYTLIDGKTGKRVEYSTGYKQVHDSIVEGLKEGRKVFWHCYNKQEIQNANQ